MKLKLFWELSWFFIMKKGSIKIMCDLICNLIYRSNYYLMDRFLNDFETFWRPHCSWLIDFLIPTKIEMKLCKIMWAVIEYNKQTSFSFIGCVVKLYWKHILASLIHNIFVLLTVHWVAGTVGHTVKVRRKRVTCLDWANISWVEMMGRDQCSH